MNILNRPILEQMTPAIGYVLGLRYALKDMKSYDSPQMRAYSDAFWNLHHDERGFIMFFDALMTTIRIPCVILSAPRGWTHADA